MKNRNTPFGYQYENGIIILHPAESVTVLDIVEKYISGSSMLSIANELNKNNIEYLPGVAGWNKARIKRLIEDKRYIGNEVFPQIINTKVYEKLQSIRVERNTQKNIDRSVGAYMLSVPVLCECGRKMVRYHDSRCAWGEKWCCECGTVIKISDEALLTAITDCINHIISHSDSIVKMNSQTIEPSNDLMRTENEISRTLENDHFNKDELKKKIIDCASMRYDGLGAVDITETLKADFEKSGPLSTFNSELLDHTASAIVLNADRTISLILKNGQKIRKEYPYATDSTKDSTCNSTDTKHNQQPVRHTIPTEIGSRLLPCVNQ